MLNQAPVREYHIGFRVGNQFRIREIDQATVVANQSAGLKGGQQAGVEMKVFLDFIANRFCQYKASDLCSAERQYRFIESPLCDDAAEEHVRVEKQTKPALRGHFARARRAYRWVATGFRAPEP